MSRIFRKFRLSQISESRSGKYFIYAIGEIILVVIGILIALQINNWNQARNDDKALKEYLGKIRSHTLKDIQWLDSLSIYRTYVGLQCKKARKSILDKTEEQNLSLLMSCGSAFMDYYFRPNTSGYEALKNSKYFGKINNTVLDSLLTNYYRIVDDIAQNESSYNHYVNGQENYLSTQFDRSLILATAFLPPDSLNIRATPQSEYYEDFAEYTASASYRNVIGLAAFQFESMVNQYKKLKGVGNGIVTEIDVLIKN
ncbi:DUF6090 family protein [Zunongwangia sp. F363]|uniref:DUF6090 family protein n=1 Tax=Autumnicola tepida TaxID=3075595 RepID=A0ABU3C9Q3_9FLAO|nr:DUF6090 family protein [Zunongwangia sp. F363]MDT0642805.1 DUF6090 family protein [Zunongwangia sp. F363]